MTSRSHLAAAAVISAVVICSGTALCAQPTASSKPPQAQPALDFEFYKARVEPVFLKKRESHTRCVVCHAESNNAFRLEKLSSGATAWSQEHSRKNFAGVSALVIPGDPVRSRLLLHPLAPERGGHVFHSGGRQFASRNDADWKAVAQWINGAKLSDPAAKTK